MVNFNRFVFITCSLLLLSCQTKQTKFIDASLLKSIFIDTNFKYTAPNNKEFSCQFINDTIKEKEAYSDALKKLISKYTEIDKYTTTDETKQYAKSLLLAEWIYGSFYYQFLGPELGMADTTNWIVDFKKTDIQSCYNAGVSGNIAVWCEDRAELFTRLVDSLLHLKTEIISFNPTHTFPLVYINNKPYIIDPYDPFIVFDKNENIVDYEMLKKDNTTACALRTKRNFGTSGELVSKKLYHQLCNDYTKENKDIGPMIFEYLSKNKLHLMVYVDSCSVEPFVMERKAYPMSSYANELALFIPQGTLNQHIKNSRLNRYYLGLDCKNK